MEDLKNGNKNESHSGHHGSVCKGIICKCSPAGQKFVKFIMVVFLAILLVSIGAALGSRRAYNNYGGDFGYRGNRDSLNSGCGMDDNWRANDNRSGGCQMHQAQDGFGCGQFQTIEKRDAVPVFTNGTPTNPDASSSFETPLR